MITVRHGDPRDPAAQALLHASHRLMMDLFAPEENHFLSVQALAGPDIRFFVACHDGQTVGCAALALRDGYGEIKAMYVDADARGSGAGAALVSRIEAEARRLGLPHLRLETGNGLGAARRLYSRHGFTDRGPFGDYVANATSVFMEKALR